MQAESREAGSAVASGSVAGRGAAGLLRQREVLLILLLVVSSLVVRIFTPYFLTLGNFQAILIGMVPVVLATIGQLMVLVSGGLDLSVGAVMALSGTVVGLLMLRGTPPLLAALLTLVVGSVFGIVNGLLITRVGVNPLVTTLGTMTIARSVALVLTEGFSVTNLPPSFAYLGQAQLLGLPPMVWLTGILVLAFDLAMRHLRFFRQIYYVGGNPRAARLSGIPVDRVQLAVYLMSALLSALAGILLASRLMAGTPTAGVGLELTTITAAVVGGASLVGGEGTVLGAVLGVLLLSVVSNASIILGVSIYWQGVVSGAILIVVVAVDMLLKKLQS